MVMMSTSRLIVTAGPTLCAAEVRERLPEAEVHDPVAADQVLRWGMTAGDRLLIIDGLFLQARAVRHKELLSLLDQGVHVFGASSMGALRAAELEAFGMRGVGAVFRDYRDGVLVGDDEVALTHADADADHRALSWALVDLRYAVRLAVEERVIDAATAAALVNCAKTLPFTRRDSPTVIGAARAQGCDQATLAAFRSFCARRRPSIKRLDALAALRQVAEAGCAGAPDTHTVPSATRGRLRYRGQPTALAVTTYLRRWTVSLPAAPADGSLAPVCGQNPDRLLPDDHLLATLSLGWRGFPALLRKVAAECLLLDTLGVPATAEFAEQRRALSPLLRMPEAEIGPDRASLPWGVLRRALWPRLDILDVSPTAALSGTAQSLLTPEEQALPWCHSGPLLATRTWHADPRVDWATPVMQRLRILPVLEWAQEVASQDARSRPLDEDAVRGMCRSLLHRWGVRRAADAPAALRIHGFLSSIDFVRAVRTHPAALSGLTRSVR
ncbi:TfuA-like protein [Streptomyces roseus]|uniref:TfuA-like protein n=1 Tax=Streptomyces roseus TaxID=66430 RepID=UPI0036BF5AE6